MTLRSPVPALASTPPTLCPVEGAPFPTGVACTGQPVSGNGECLLLGPPVDGAVSLTGNPTQPPFPPTGPPKTPFPVRRTRVLLPASLPAPTQPGSWVSEKLWEGGRKRQERAQTLSHVSSLSHHGGPVMWGKVQTPVTPAAPLPLTSTLRTKAFRSSAALALPLISRLCSSFPLPGILSFSTLANLWSKTPPSPTY